MCTVPLWGKLTQELEVGTETETMDECGLLRAAPQASHLAYIFTGPRTTWGEGEPHLQWAGPSHINKAHRLIGLQAKLRETFPQLKFLLPKSPRLELRKILTNTTYLFCAWNETSQFRIPTPPSGTMMPGITVLSSHLQNKGHCCLLHGTVNTNLVNEGQV